MRKSSSQGLISRRNGWISVSGNGGRAGEVFPVSKAGCSFVLKVGGESQSVKSLTQIQHLFCV